MLARLKSMVKSGPRRVEHGDPEEAVIAVLVLAQGDRRGPDACPFAAVVDHQLVAGLGVSSAGR
jgi:hypothetical protein